MDPDFDALLHDVSRQRLTGLLVAAIDDGAIRVTPSQRDRSLAALEPAMLRVMLLERRLVQLAASFADDGIEFRVLKGPAVARNVYEQPSHRLFADLDLLIHPARFTDAVTILQARGYTRPIAQLRPEYDRDFAKTVLLLDHDGLQVDLHRMLALGPFGHRLPLEDLFASRRTLSVAGHDLTCLDMVEQFLHVCYHATLGDDPPKLVALRDVLQALYDDRLDAHEVRRVAAAWGGEAAVARAIRQAVDTLGVTPPHELVGWAQRHRASLADRIGLASYRASPDANLRKALASLPAIDGWRERLSYLRTMALPSDEFLDRRGLDRRSWLRRQQRRAWRTGGGH